MSKLIVIYEGEMLKFNNAAMLEPSGKVIDKDTRKVIVQLNYFKIDSFHYKKIKK